MKLLGLADRIMVIHDGALIEAQQPMTVRRSG